MTAIIKAWRCIGCGSLEAPQPCIGVCEQRRVELVDAFDHADALARLAAVTAQRDAMTALLRRLAFTRPRDGECGRTLHIFQRQAREALARMSDDALVS